MQQTAKAGALVTAWWSTMVDCLELQSFTFGVGIQQICRPGEAQTPTPHSRAFIAVECGGHNQQTYESLNHSLV